MYRRIILVAVVLVISITGCGDDSPVSPGHEPEFDFSGDLIAFRSDRDGNDDIWLMTPDGSESINITNNSSGDSDPAWSPDGERIAFVSTRTGSAELFVMDVDGSNVIQVTENQGSVRFPNWSPDGSLIAFSSNINDQRDIYITPVPPGVHSKQTANNSLNCDDVVQVTDHPETDNEPVWSPDGSTIYFFSTRDGFGGVWELEFDCTGGKKLVKLTVEFDFSCAPGIGWSLVDSQVKVSFVGKTTPSSSQKSGVIMTRDSEQQVDQYDIWVMDLDGSNKKNVTNHPGTDWSSTWSNDGENLIFDTDRNDNWDIYSITEGGSGLTQLTDHPADDRYPAWRP